MYIEKPYAQLMIFTALVYIEDLKKGHPKNKKMQQHVGMLLHITSLISSEAKDMDPIINPTEAV